MWNQWPNLQPPDARCTFSFKLGIGVKARHYIRFQFKYTFHVLRETLTLLHLHWQRSTTARSTIRANMADPHNRQSCQGDILHPAVNYFSSPSITRLHVSACALLLRRHLVVFFRTRKKKQEKQERTMLIKLWLFVLMIWFLALNY